MQAYSFNRVFVGGFIMNRYRGRYNIQGEVHELWGWYVNEGEARCKLKRKLEKKCGRVIFLNGIDHQVDRVDPVAVK